MAWTAPRTWVTGEVLTSTLLNTHLRDNMISLRSSYGTTFPGSPNDGDEAILVDNASNPTYQWQFRYNAGSSSAYKWEFVGGPALLAALATTTLPAHGGDYLIIGKGYFGNGGTTTGGDQTATLAVGATTIDTTVQNGPSTAASGTSARGQVGTTLIGKITSAASGATITMTALNNPQLHITPCRLS